MEIPGLPAGIGGTDEELEAWITGHYAAAEDHFGGNPNYLGFDIADPATHHLLEDFLGIRLPWWGVANIRASPRPPAAEDAGAAAGDGAPAPAAPSPDSPDVDERILAAALALSADGDGDFTFTQLAKAAGTSESTLRRRFPNREALESALAELTPAPVLTEAELDADVPPEELEPVAPEPVAAEPLAAPAGTTEPVPTDAPEPAPPDTPWVPAAEPRVRGVLGILDGVPPHLVADQLVAEARHMAGVDVALYVLADDGVRIVRAAGAHGPPALPGAPARDHRRAAPPALRRAGGASARAVPRRARRRHAGGGTTDRRARNRGRAARVARRRRPRGRDGARAGARTHRPRASAERARRRRGCRRACCAPRTVRVTRATVCGGVLPGRLAGGDWFDVADNVDGTWLAAADPGGSGPGSVGLGLAALGALRGARHDGRRRRRGGRGDARGDRRGRRRRRGARLPRPLARSDGHARMGELRLSAGALRFARARARRPQGTDLRGTGRGRPDRAIRVAPRPPRARRPVGGRLGRHAAQGPGRSCGRRGAAAARGRADVGADGDGYPGGDPASPQGTAVTRTTKPPSWSCRSTDRCPSPMTPQDPPRSESPDRPRAAIIAVAKNEGVYLHEWIAYHKVIGFDDVLVYDNDSTDGSSEMLAELAGHGLVTPIPWHVEPDVAPQTSAYRDGLERLGEDYGWVAFIDLDEFIVIPRHDTIGDFLAEFGGRRRDRGQLEELRLLGARALQPRAGHRPLPPLLRRGIRAQPPREGARADQGAQPADIGRAQAQAQGRRALRERQRRPDRGRTVERRGARSHPAQPLLHEVGRGVAVEGRPGPWRQAGEFARAQALVSGLRGPGSQRGRRVRHRQATAGAPGADAAHPSAHHRIAAAGHPRRRRRWRLGSRKHQQGGKQSQHEARHAPRSRREEAGPPPSRRRTPRKPTWIATRRSPSRRCPSSSRSAGSPAAGASARWTPTSTRCPGTPTRRSRS